LNPKDEEIILIGKIFLSKTCFTRAFCRPGARDEGMLHWIDELPIRNSLDVIPTNLQAGLKKHEPLSIHIFGPISHLKLQSFPITKRKEFNAVSIPDLCSYLIRGVHISLVAPRFEWRDLSLWLSVRLEKDNFVGSLPFIFLSSIRR
jgi:hypothetical protein